MVELGESEEVFVSFSRSLHIPTTCTDLHDAILNLKNCLNISALHACLTVNGHFCIIRKWWTLTIFELSREKKLT